MIKNRMHTTEPELEVHFLPDLSKRARCDSDLQRDTVIKAASSVSSIVRR